MTINEFWRDPVKSMDGEQTEAVDMTVNGIARDRVSITLGRVAAEPVELISPI